MADKPTTCPKCGSTKIFVTEHPFDILRWTVNCDACLSFHVVANCWFNPKTGEMLTHEQYERLKATLDTSKSRPG